MAEREYSGVTPEVGDDRVYVPVTIDYSAGRIQNVKSRILWAVLGLFGTLVLTLGFLLSDSSLLVKVPLSMLIFYAGTWVVRFPILGEHKYRKELMNRQKNDYKVEMSNFWGIYRVDDAGVCYFRNGYAGYFVMLEKGAILGKTDEEEFGHYQAMTNGYNIIATSGMRVAHIDIMDFIGSDARLVSALRRVADYDNPNLRGIVEDIFRDLQDQAENTVTSHDIYLFMYKGPEYELERKIEKVLNCFMDSDTGYRSYQFLGARDIQMVARAMFNLHEFSIVDAKRKSFKFKEGKPRIEPLSLTSPEGIVTELGKTMAEKKEEAAAKAELNKALESERRRRKKNPNAPASSEDEYIDIFSAEKHSTVDTNDATGIFDDFIDSDVLDSVDIFARPKGTAEEDMFSGLFSSGSEGGNGKGSTKQHYEPEEATGDISDLFDD